MENQLHSNNNFLILNHLPRILNVIQIINMMMYGFVNNQPIFFVQAIGSIQKSIQLPSKRQLRNWFRKQLYAALRITYYAMLSFAFLLLSLSSYFTANALFIAGCLLLPVLVIRLWVIHKSIMQVHKLLHPGNYDVGRNTLTNYLPLFRSTFHTLVMPIHYN